MSNNIQLAQEKKALLDQRESLMADYKVKSEALLKDLNTTTQASLDPLNNQIAEIEKEILRSVDQEAGIGGACPA